MKEEGALSSLATLKKIKVKLTAGTITETALANLSNLITDRIVESRKDLEVAKLIRCNECCSKLKSDDIKHKIINNNMLTFLTFNLSAMLSWARYSNHNLYSLVTGYFYLKRNYWDSWLL